MWLLDGAETKTFNEKLKTQIILTGERCIPFKIERRQGSPLSFTSVSTILDFLAKTMNERKKKSDVWIRGEGTKMPLSADNVIVT